MGSGRTFGNFNHSRSYMVKRQTQYYKRSFAGSGRESNRRGGILRMFNQDKLVYPSFAPYRYITGIGRQQSGHVAQRRQRRYGCTYASDKSRIYVFGLHRKRSGKRFFNHIVKRNLYIEIRLGFRGIQLQMD